MSGARSTKTRDAGPARVGRTLPPWLLVPAAVLAISSTASAHMGSTKYIEAEVTEQGALLRVDLDLIDVAYELGLPFDPPDPARALASLDGVQAWLARDMRVTSDGRPCALRVEDPAIATRQDSPYLSLTLRYTCPRGERVVLHDDSVFADDARHEAFVRLVDADDTVATVLSAGHREVDLGTPPSPVAQVGRFVWEGAMHLITGYDHLLFLLSLLLVAGELAAKDGLRKTARDVALVVTGFTLGHSVTLIAAALDWVSLPVRWVEAAIALSIAVVAVWNLVRPEARRALPGVAVGFGLIHGFGFSNVLRELALPSGQRVLALLSFNVGIELAQLAFVAVALAPLAYAARRDWYRPVVTQGGSVVITVIALFWFVERLSGG